MKLLHYTDLRLQAIPPKPFALFWTLVVRRMPLRSIALVLSAAGGIGLMGLEPLLLKALFDGMKAYSASSVDAQASVKSLIWIFSAVVAVWFASAGFNRLREWIDLYTAPRARFQAQTLLFSWLLQHSSRYFKQNFAGTLTQNVKQVGASMVGLTGLLLNDAVRLVITIGMSVAILAPLSKEFFWALLLWVGVYFWLSYWFARKTAPMFKEYTRVSSRCGGVMTDIVGNIDLVRSFVKQQTELERVAVDLALECKTSEHNRKFVMFMNFVLYSGVLLFQSGFIGYALYLFLHGQLSVGDVVMVISLSSILVLNVNGLSGQLLAFYEQVGSLTAALDALLLPHEVRDAPDARPLRLQGGAITFEGLCFSHRDGSEVFKDFDFKVRAGEKLGLVGHSGAGKSTLLKLLCRQYDLTGGRILIDGQDVAQLTLASLNRAIADVPQDPGLFHRSLRDNVKYAQPDASDLELHQALRDAQCLDFIAERAEGLEAVVGERGTHLSGGERQRIAIARALLKDAPILLLDEATSALDSETEALIRSALDKLMQGRTVIAIAHRLSTLTAMDRIVFIDKGRIVEQGSHTELLALNGAYARMWERQASGFIQESD